MNRYSIKDIKSGAITHFYNKDSPLPHQNAWGLLERLKWEDECTPEELASAIEVIEVEVRPAIPGDPEADPPTDDIPAVTRTQVSLPKTYEVIVTDLQPEIDAENTKRTQIAALKTRLDALDGQADLTAAEVKETIRKLVKFIKFRGLLD